MLRARILGAGAGGGLPQWNCGCANCRDARSGKIPSLTQSSLAVTANGRDWAILNASPDIRQQLADCPPLHPTDLRITPIHSVLLTNGDLDHIGGLLTLREKQAFTLFATEEIHKVLSGNSVFDALDPALVTRRIIALDQDFDLAPGLTARLFSVPGKVPLFMEGDVVETDLEGEQTVGVALTDGGTRAFYIPGCARLDAKLADRIRASDLVFFDGTLWRDDEMIATGTGIKTGARMGHMSMSGPDGTIAAFAPLDVARKIFVHMNNTNPVLVPGSPERVEAQAAGWTIGQDGMEFEI